MGAFDVSFFNKKISCIPGENPDPETGCIACGDNARSDYEQCRQSYYLKKQNEIIGTTRQSNAGFSDGKISKLEKLVEDQNQQITELVENSQKDIEIIKELRISLTNTYLLSIVLGLISVALVIFLIIRKFRK